MNTVDLFRAMLPPSYDPNGKYISAELAAEANVMDAVKASAARVLAQITPLQASMTLSDWERVYGVVPREGSTQQERRQNILVRMAATGGLSIPYFKSLAASLGYTITITEPRPFRVGINRCGDRLLIPEICWVWQINVIGTKTPVYRFRTGASATGEPLTAFGESILENTFKDLKPAFTDCYFTYDITSQSEPVSPLTINRIQIQSVCHADEPLLINNTGMHFAVIPVLKGKPLTINNTQLQAGNLCKEEPLLINRMQLLLERRTIEPLTVNTIQWQSGRQTTEPMAINKIHLQTANNSSTPLVVNHNGLHYAVITEP